MPTISMDINLQPAADVDILTADVFRILASPIRLAILRALVSSERCVGDLVAELDVAQSRLSNHLACLRHCGLVTTRRHGTFVYYRLADREVADLVRLGEELASKKASGLRSCPVVASER